ncbi:MAG TPA: hypothetical protein VNC40_09395 [Gaiellaceae bacterium]|nr:hypothetical protein [Gaiellaceae bacterium]
MTSDGDEPLEQLPPPADAALGEFPLLMRRRLAVSTVAVAALVLVGVAAGYALGHSKAKPAAFTAKQAIPMQGKAALAVLRIGPSDSVGNSPLELDVSGLPVQPNRQSDYELWLTRGGKPVVACGSFRVNANSTTVRLSAPFPLSSYDGWVVTAQPAGTGAPGAVVLRASF